MRPTVGDIFGGGARFVPPFQSEEVSGGLFIPFSSLGYEGDPVPYPPDGQVIVAKLMLRMSQTLNESNRASNRDGIVVTITYSDYDKIFDPPGSQSLVRRDVFSVIAYDEEASTPFDPDMLEP